MNFTFVYLAKASFGSPCEIYNAEYKKLAVLPIACYRLPIAYASAYARDRGPAHAMGSGPDPWAPPMQTATSPTWASAANRQ